MQITVPFTVALLSVLEVSARTFKGGLLERRTTTDDCANLVNAPLKVSVQGIGQITVGYISSSATRFPPFYSCLNINSYRY